MRQDGRPCRYRRKRCLHCGDLFDPDRRTKGQQRYCSADSCQEYRQRLNEKNWRQKNPECLRSNTNKPGNGIEAGRNTTGTGEQTILVWSGGTASPRGRECDGLGHNRRQFKRVANRKVRLPAGKLYDLSGAFG